MAPQVGRTGKGFLDHLVNANNDANPELQRLALKLATGAGKTTVMAMLIAWQTVNAVRHPQSRRFTRGFLVVTPGITIKDRLRVLQPNDPDSYYQSRELVPSDMLPDLQKAKIIITNYHAFKLRDRMELSKGGRSLLQGRGQVLATLETEGQMLQRVMPGLMGMKNVIVLNDEAHHCYREKPGEGDEAALTGEDKEEAKKNTEAAHLWISGLESVARKLGVARVVDLSATPFFLRGSGYAEGTLFPWTMNDFSLMDAIECGIVKLPRVPVADNVSGDEMPKFRNLWEQIRGRMPKKGRGKAGNLDPLNLPTLLKTALEALYGHYKKTFDAMAEAGIEVPPCFIVVCNNTSTSKLVYDYISGFHRDNADGSTKLENGRLELFRNFDEHGNPYPRPRTLLIDSEQLESGDSLDRDFRKMAAEEIERFRREIIERTGDRQRAEKISDQDLLREVMNTVGKHGRLGDTIRCVVSVSMLTEGWDANTVSHVLGVRAFGTQLLCEQVVGRALRRQSYDLNEEGLFDVEYADVLGIPFDFTAKPVVVPPKPPQQTVQVKAVRPERDPLEIRFPRVAGYRVELPQERLRANFNDNSVLNLTPDLVGPSITRTQGIIGQGVDLLVWRGKDVQDWTDLVVQAPPLFIQEKVHPKALIEDLLRRSKQGEEASDETGFQPDLFADFNGLPSEDAKTEFYQHDANWSNRMILGDSLQVMASLAEREGLRGKVQCIYIDPPYGIKFNSNFQWSTTSNVVRDGKAEHITREPEQVKAFRDTWRDGIHSYMTYLRDRLTVARDLLGDSGSVFVQIGDENAHRVRVLLDEIFGDDNFVANIQFRTKIPLGTTYLAGVTDYLLWYGKDRSHTKYRKLFFPRAFGEGTQFNAVRGEDGIIRPMTKEEASGEENIVDHEFACRGLDLVSAGRTESCVFDAEFEGRVFRPSSKKSWKTNPTGFERCKKANRILAGNASLSYLFMHNDYPVQEFSNMWSDTQGASGKTYVVQTSDKIIQRCILMTTDPGDLVLDPTCGSGTTAYVAEQWGRRWITIDTSRVALALARARIMGARYPYYLLADSRDGQIKEAALARKALSEAATYNDIRQGFVCERVPHITLKSIANNTEIDVIWEEFQKTFEPLRQELNAAVNTSYEEWEIPRDADDAWSEDVRRIHSDWWEQRVARQKEIDASIVAKADYEYLYDKPYDDSKKARVAGPFTVESLSPHRLLGVDEHDELIDRVAESTVGYGDPQDFAAMILENLKTSGVQQAHKEDHLAFSSIRPWPGSFVCAEGTYVEGNADSGPRKRAGIFIGPEFGTVSRPDLVSAVREAADADFDVLIACAFNYDAHASEFNKLGRVPVLKARMNADLHMAGDLKNTGKGNLFVIFGEPDIGILDAEDGQMQVKVNGVDVFHPNTGEIRSDSSDGIACWFIDTDYNEESFFVRHAYFLGANDPYKALKTTLKAEINQEAWETLHSDTSRPFDKPASGRIAVKVINHLGDEVMKVFRV